METKLTLRLEDKLIREDAVIHQACVVAGVDCIVTRNAKDFSKAKVTVYEPDDLATTLGL